MSVFNGILLGCGAALASVAAACAAELPSRQAAPIEYVRICDAYGDGFFYIPGTDTCLRVGGLALGEVRTYSVSYRMANLVMGQPGIGVKTALGLIPSSLIYGNATGGSNTGFVALGRIELDARTASELGALRAFVRLESQFGSETNAALGALSGIGNFYGQFYNNNTALFSPSRETTILNKAFIQFAGLTAGRVQSFFDFYADQANWEALRGSNATVAALAYTQTFGEGFSGALSIEDNASRRDFIGSTIGNFDFGASIGKPGFGASYAAVPGGSRVPEIVGNLRLDQGWGALQVSAAAHQLRTSLYDFAALAVTPAIPAPPLPSAYAFPAATSQEHGFAAQLGGQFNLDKVAPQLFSPGDKLWLQATYEEGATGYVTGNNLSFSGGAVNGNDFYGYGNGGVKAGNGWDFRIYDCVWTAFGHCDKSQGWAVLAALRHYWLPTLSSGLFGSYMGLRYSGAALAAVGNGVGVVNTDEVRIGSNLVWTPIKNFDFGGEVMYLRDLHRSRPIGLAPDPVLNSAGLPSWKSINSTVEGRVRVQRAF
ncbi:MAG: porin [Methylocystis sp.]|nr:porin [Methylocystis sp.]